MSPKGNCTEKRGHRARLGGEKSKGSIQKSVRLPVELIAKIDRKIGKTKGAFSEFVRGLIEKDFLK